VKRFDREVMLQGLICIFALCRNFGFIPSISILFSKTLQKQ